MLKRGRFGTDPCDFAAIGQRMLEEIKAVDESAAVQGRQRPGQARTAGASDSAFSTRGPKLRRSGKLAQAARTGPRQCCAKAWMRLLPVMVSKA